MAAAQKSSAGTLALAFGALVVYASLYPFTGWRWPPGASWEQLVWLPWPPWRIRFDQWANLLGYVPLGFLASVAWLRRGWATWQAVLVALLASSALSYALEVTQHFLPGRHPSLIDWAGNSTGALIGALAGLAAQVGGLLYRWQLLRERWFVPESAGALTLLTLWPMALLFPTPVPLGLGQIGERLREWTWQTVDGVPWAATVQELLESRAIGGEPLTLLSETLVTGLGLLAPCLVAFAIVAPGWRRVVLAFGGLALALAGMTLSTVLNFGPEHATTWMTPASLPALMGATVVAAALAPLPRRICAGLGLLALGAGLALVARAPADPYFAHNLQAWEQGRFVHFHGLAQWVGWLWPYAAIVWLLSRLGLRD